MVQFQTISILTPQRVTVISEGRQKGGGGESKAKAYKGKYEAKLGFPEETGGVGRVAQTENPP